MIEFLHKGAHIANLTGEKISESQVVAAVRSVIDEMRLTLSHFTVSPVWGDPPRYHLQIEQGDIPGRAGRRFAGSQSRRTAQARSTASTERSGPRAAWPR